MYGEVGRACGARASLTLRRGQGSRVDWKLELSTIQRVSLVKIGELAKRSGVPIATIKHYLREGLIAPTKKSGRTMSWYDQALISRIRTIKELQRRHFLPLDVIRRAIDSDAEASDDVAAAEAIAGVLARHGGKRAHGRDELLARGASVQELDWLAAAGLARPGPDHRYRGDDLALLSTLGAARKAGLGADMLPFEILQRYLGALRALVAVELEMFRAGVFPRTGTTDVRRLTTAATRLSERLVVLIRRQLLLPTLARMIEEEAREPMDARVPDRRVRRQPVPRRRRRPRSSH
jgi:DNA-binding transcriptional MerR regulator